MKSTELKRMLDRMGATYSEAKGSHIKVYLHGKQTILPMHGKDLGPLADAILKQLGVSKKK
jgi:mRNA interferase HicA